jgi:hypothetical protein
MIEQFIFNLITTDSALQALLSAGGGKYHLYPSAIPRGVVFDRAVSFSLISSNDAFPVILVQSVQFSIFAKKHSDTVAIAKALADLFNGNGIRNSGGLTVVFSMRQSESDLGFDYDNEGLYQREATYNFKVGNND